MILVGVFLALAARGGRHGGSTARSASAAGAGAVVWLVSPLLLPETLAAVLEIGLGVLVRMVVAFAVGLAAEPRGTASPMADGPASWRSSMIRRLPERLGSQERDEQSGVVRCSALP